MFEGSFRGVKLAPGSHRNETNETREWPVSQIMDTMVSRAFHNNPMRTNDERIQSFKELWKKERGEDLTDAQALEYSDTHRPKYEIALARLFFKILWCGTFLWLFHRFLVHQPYIIYFPYKIHRDTKT